MSPAAQPTRVEVLWHELGTSLHGFFRARGAGREDAEDLVGETFLRVQGALDSLRDGERSGAWVGRIARNVWIDSLRRRAPATSELELDELAAGEPESDAPTRGFALWLAGAIDELEPGYGLPLRRFELEGRSQAEIAAELGLSLTATKSRIQRGRELLRRRFNACCSLTRDSRGGILDVLRRTAGRDCDC